MIGWALATALAVGFFSLRRRLDLIADAEHELRGPVAALALAVEALRREPGGARRAMAFESQLDRIGAGLDDLAAARTCGRRARPAAAAFVVERQARAAVAGWRPAALRARRPIRVRWDAGPVIVRADRGRFAQSLGNLLANSLEHGSGRVELHGRRVAGAVRIEISDAGTSAPPGKPGPERGRGLAIAGRAARDAGGSVTFERRSEGTVAALELPLAEP